jgi:hypothetical protein
MRPIPPRGSKRRRRPAGRLLRRASLPWSAADGTGGYYSHLETDENHGQIDYAATCLIGALRRDAGLDAKTSVEHLEPGFQSRSGWCLANPYLVDWALGGDDSAQELRDRLADDRAMQL